MAEREKYIDNAKAFAIILVVAGHIAVMLTESPHDFWGILSYFIYCFHMPFFFVLSGLSFGAGGRIKGKRLSYIVSRCFDLVWVVLVFNVLSFLLQPGQLMQAYENGGLFSVALECAGNYWFLTVLCVIYMAVPWVRDFNMPVILGVLLLSLVCGTVHMGLAKLLLYLFFFMLGMYLSQGGRKLEGHKWLAVFVPLSIIWYFVSDGKLLDDVYTKTVLGTSGSLFFLSVFKKGTKDRAAFSKLGENTLIVYLTHGWVLGFLSKCGLFSSCTKPELFLLLIVGCFLVCGIVIMLLEKFPKLK